MSHVNANFGLGLLTNTSCSLSTTITRQGNALVLTVRLMLWVQYILLYGDLLYGSAGDCSITVS